MTVHIDLRRDLPKVRKRANFDAVGACLYASPCAVGAMIPKKFRAEFDQREWKGVSCLLRDGAISAPADQWDDLVELQGAFDRSGPQRVEAVLAALEVKYLSASVDRSGEADETSTKIEGSAEGESAVTAATPGDAQ